ncbi:MAG: RidA family protein [Pseudomonadota bacterium]
MRQVITTDRAPAAIGPYSQAIASGEMVFCSGQIPLDPATGQLVGAGDVVLETRQVLDNLEAVLKAAGCALRDVVKTTIFLADMNDFGAVNALYGERFSSEPPARATVQVAALPKGARVEIEAIAVKSR